jgi:hypothetical protein
VKEFCGGGATRLKEHLAEKSGNVVWCTKYTPDIREYFLDELQRAREQKKAINDERLIECKAQFQNPMMKIRNCRRC